ncbi:acetyl/propionyl/methylcrotonyl-CoA carboxylase subunit alpha [Devosia sp. 63-57]|uniref:acetyl-CoA carboxylase biotin carboxylase subunit n=1 Tax=Devosia sp. 63-57 TaxID=1895751 RepID=UPI00086D8F19|nr:acetyl/propionyl/methylcrotonyl-CoA carboxylase subunit alpha [Devosia sp. 63-57]ODT48208.1 MAG: acetyl/propionyl-CoA carboxylase subuit alpha [Pelagibacterium sp. SCN 63-126]ODU85340.1 MAG: acetyl/propionyl-CoA carboxylase subuit alpha [Pelagibacterium sp. SCN 63-17]OJX42082.1 MAG: acetyl/propionyl-CoA carboxylase subuit alpha [Devosia sp. 63-57]
MKIQKLLIANRGEIACRVIKTARKLGIATVAVYSDADREALHVRMADEAVHIGASPAKESYLQIDKIIAACKQTGAQAVHPGYGFLSENAAFSAALEKEGIIFVGPPPKAIQAMGDKITSKKLAAEAGVSTVPGHMGLIDDAAHAVTIAQSIGYPVMIKASAGGGGKGMRIAWNDAEAREGFERSKSEAASSFGDDRIFIEKFVTEPRHIEIQLIADGHGNALYLNERECSIQRRNQKVIEEAPSPFLDEATRKAMGEQSAALAKAVGYRSAGTVEFIVDKDRNFYFLEMNTRLQVEHPVTELITGLDLVELMLRVADGEALPLSQDEVQRNGWAIESRLYAEDPYRNFLPSTGRLTRYRPPAESASETLVVRNDTGVFEGGEISTFYDPMIAKLCTWAPTRLEAVDAMAIALDSFEVEGVGNNLPFLSTVMEQQRFRDGRLTTGYIAEEFPEGFSGAVLSDDHHFDVVAGAAMLMARRQQRRTGAEAESRWHVQVGERAETVVLHQHGPDILVDLDWRSEAVRLSWQPGDTLAHLDWSGGRHAVLKVNPTTSGFRIRYRGADLKVLVLQPHVAHYLKYMPVKVPPDMSRFLLCPMPGQVVRIDVKEGDVVEDGQTLAVVEAMKMENVLKAEKRARVSKVHVVPGAVLAVDQVMLEFEVV